MNAQQQKTIRTIARDDARHLYRSCEDAVQLSYTPAITTLADDAISSAAPDLDDEQIAALRPAYLSAFWTAWNSMTSH